MRAFQLQFNENLLDPSFLRGINPGTSDRLLHISMLGCKRLRDCINYQMNEEQRFRYITLQDNLITNVELFHDSHVTMRDHDQKHINESKLLDTLMCIMQLAEELFKQSLAAFFLPPFALIGQWPVNERCAAIGPCTT